MKYSFGLVLGVVLMLSLGGQVFAQTQMTVNITNYSYDAFKPVPVDKDFVVISGEQFGLTVAEGGKGPFNNMSFHSVLIVYADKAERHFHGYVTEVDKDGDKSVWEIWDFPSGTPNRGKGKVIGGTGKFTGMEGTAEDIVIEHPKGWPEGTGRSIATMVWKVTLRTPLP
jgi:hypothetical protein